MSVYVEDFENCCGIKIIAGFNTEESGSDDDEDAPYRDDLPSSVGDVREVLQKNQTRKDVGLLVATTIRCQINANEALTTEGYEQTLTFRNPNTTEIVTLWTKKIGVQP